MEPTSPAPTPPPEPLGRGATIGAFAAIVVAGLLGGTIGAGLVDVSYDDAGAWVVVGALVGAVIGAGGVGIVAVLVLRAMQEWESHQRQASAVEAAGRSAAEAAGRSAAGPPAAGASDAAPGGAPVDDVPSDGPLR